MTTDRWDSALYDDKHSYVWKYGAELLDLLAAQPGERILDLGAGTGHLTAQIAAAGASVVGLDASAVMLAQARQTYPDIEFVQGDAADFAFEQPFDAVFSNATLHWVKRAAEAAGCIARALKPGGRFVAEFGGKGNVANIVAALEGARRSRGLPVGAAVSPWYYPALGEHSALLESYGLDVVYARLFDRPVELEGGESGLRDWLEMFGGAFMADLPATERDAFLRDVEERLRPAGFRDGVWNADYRRLRLVAIKA